MLQEHPGVSDAEEEEAPDTEHVAFPLISCWHITHFIYTLKFRRVANKYTRGEGGRHAEERRGPGDVEGVVGGREAEAQV